MCSSDIDISIAHLRYHFHYFYEVNVKLLTKLQENGGKINKVTLNPTCHPDGRNKKYNFGGELFWKITVLGSLKCDRIMLGLILGKQVER
jgi:hypothetical protein